MENKKIGFIGGGNMGGALAQAAIHALGKENVLLSDSTPTATKVLSQNIGATPSTHKEIATTCRLIFIAVKPNVVPAVLEKLKPLLAERTDNYALVSIAAGVTVESILRIVGEDVHVIRMMPNTAVSVGQGMIVFVPHCDDEDVRIFEEAMSRAGMVDPINESLIDAATAVMGCGPAFAYMFIEALADGGVSCGLTRQEAKIYAAQMVAGAATMLLATGKHPGELKDAVCSPGGSTIQGVRTLEENGFRSAAVEAVIASYEKTKELGRK